MLRTLSKSDTPFQRPQAAELAHRLREPRRHIQAIAGARQVGKTTLVRQVIETIDLPVTGLFKFARHTIRQKGIAPKAPSPEHGSDHRSAALKKVRALAKKVTPHLYST